LTKSPYPQAIINFKPHHAEKRVKNTWPLSWLTDNDADSLSVGQSRSEQNSLIHSRKLSPYFIAFSSAMSSSSIRFLTVVGLCKTKQIKIQCHYTLQLQHVLPSALDASVVA